jgi:hypothetical protein
MTTPIDNLLKGGARPGLAFSELKGGDGAADYMLKVAGDMNQQGNNGALQYKMPGGGSADMLVPATLVFASQYANKLFPKKGGNYKQQGGLGVTDVAVPALLVLASNAMGKGKRFTRSMKGGNADMIGSIKSALAETPAVGGDATDLMNSMKSATQSGGVAPMIIPAGLLIGSTLAPKLLGRRSSVKRVGKLRHRKSYFRKHKK